VVPCSRLFGHGSQPGSPVFSYFCCVIGGDEVDTGCPDAALSHFRVIACLLKSHTFAFRSSFPLLFTFQVVILEFLSSLCWQSFTSYLCHLPWPVHFSQERFISLHFDFDWDIVLCPQCAAFFPLLMLNQFFVHFPQFYFLSNHVADNVKLHVLLSLLSNSVICYRHRLKLDNEAV